jgi:transmembrane sensor
MKNYTFYTLEDFVGDEDFIGWVQGRSNSNEFWSSFAKHYPDKAEVLKHAEQIIRTAQVQSDPIDNREIKEEVTQFLRNAGRVKMAQTDAGISPKTRFPVTRLLKACAIAAAAVLVCGLIWSVFYSGGRGIEPGLSAINLNSLAQTKNDTDKPLRIILSDNSVVVLSPQSTLSYPSVFAGMDRKVYLTGEASFSVTHLSTPFMVYTGEMVTKVMGTRFVVRSFESEKKISVQVQSGKVSVYSTKPSVSSNAKEKDGVILTANQAAFFEKSKHQLSKTLVANPAVVIKDNKVLNFYYDEVPLPVIIRELEKSYAIPIQFDEQNFQKCRITATFSRETLFEKLELLCKTVGATYEIVDGQIAISGAGCN